MRVSGWLSLAAALVLALAGAAAAAGGRRTVRMLKTLTDRKVDALIAPYADTSSFYAQLERCAAQGEALGEAGLGVLRGRR